MKIHPTLAVSVTFSHALFTAFAAPTVPQGFEVQEFAREPMVKNIVSFGLDEAGRLYDVEGDRAWNGVEDNRPRSFWLLDDLASQSVADRVAMYHKWADRFTEGFAHFTNKSDRVRQVVDRDGDGKADAATDFALGFNAPEDGLASGVLAWDGNVWLANIPRLWRLADRNGDGVAEEREAVHDGFGIRVALLGHDMHGLTMGPDGRLYWSIGDRGYHVTNREGRVFHGGGFGAVFRCELDGSNLETFYTSLRNPQELCFDHEGNLFTVDNNSDAGDKARVSYLIEGGETGWNMRYQTLEGENLRGPWTQEKIWHTAHSNQPAWIVPPLMHLTSGPSGLTRDPGIGLPPSYRDCFFICDFTGTPDGSAIWSFRVEHDGAAFKVVEPQRAIRKTLPTDVDFGYDGCLYISDWINGWNPPEKGIVWRVQPTDPTLRKEGAETAQLFREGFTNRTSEQLDTLLAHRDYRVRLRSHLELARRGESARLYAIANQLNAAPLARRHAIWALGILARKQPDLLDRASLWFVDASEDIRAQACRVAGDARTAKLGPELIECLSDESAYVRSLAAIAVGKLKPAGAARAIFGLLEKNADRDPWLRHAGIMALTGCATPAQLAGFSAHSNASIRLAAAVALRKHASPQISAFLKDRDERVVAEAVRAIHDLPLISELPKLADLLESYQGQNPAILRRLISAGYQLGEAERARVIANVITRNVPPVIQREALIALLEWTTPPPRDRVTGEFKELGDRKDLRAAVAAAIRQQVDRLAGEKASQARVAALKLSVAYELPLPHAVYVSLYRDKSAGDDVRAGALRALVKDASGRAAFIPEALRDRSMNLRMEGRRLWTLAEPAAAVTELVAIAEKGERAERQQALALLGTLKDQPAAMNLLQAKLKDLLAGKLPGDVALDVVEAASAADAPALKTDLTAYQQKTQTGDPMDAKRICLEGGDETRGAEIFQGATAMCTKCHKINGRGGSDAGPDLGGVAGRRKREELLLALVNPSAQIATGFSAPSPMPPMGLVLPPRDVRDLVAYLSGLKGKRDIAAHGE